MAANDLIPAVPPPEDPIPDAPPPELRYRRGFAFRSSLPKLWEARHIVWNLGMRELRVRYNQAVLGFGWAIVGPGRADDRRQRVPEAGQRRRHQHARMAVSDLLLHRACWPGPSSRARCRRPAASSCRTRCSTRSTRRARGVPTRRPSAPRASTRSRATIVLVALFAIYQRHRRRRSCGCRSSSWSLARVHARDRPDLLGVHRVPARPAPAAPAAAPGRPVRDAGRSGR